jgi:hypothetical protein
MHPLASFRQDTGDPRPAKKIAFCIEDNERAKVVTLQRWSSLPLTNI